MTVLVTGASGFLGSHVVEALVESGISPRILTRSGSNVDAFSGDDQDHRHGDVLDRQSLLRAMDGCDTVYHCVVDPRAWLRDPAPLYCVNVEGLRNTLEVAMEVGVSRFVFTSTFVTIGLRSDGPATEADVFNWGKEAPPYVHLRNEAERLFFEFCERGLSGVACCVAMTFGHGDRQPTAHGDLMRRIVGRQMPVYWDAHMNVVDIRDAAQGMVLAAERGRSGERYILSDRYISLEEFCRVAAERAGVKAPKYRIPTWMMYAGVAAGEGVNRLLGRDSTLTLKSLYLLHAVGPLDSSKARQELGWAPRPLEQSIDESIVWIRENVTT